MTDPLPQHPPKPSQRYRALVASQARRYGTSHGTVIRAYARLLQRSFVTAAGWRYGDGPGRGIPLRLLARLEQLAATDDLAPILALPGIDSGRPGRPPRAIAPGSDPAPQNPGTCAIATSSQNPGTCAMPPDPFS